MATPYMSWIISFKERTSVSYGDIFFVLVYISSKYPNPNIFKYLLSNFFRLQIYLDIPLAEYLKFAIMQLYDHAKCLRICAYFGLMNENRKNGTNSTFFFVTI